MNKQSVRERQPRALFYLSFTELWERFGFYIVQGLLILFLIHHVGLADHHAYQLLGEFTALVYISPLIGGFVADQLLGARYSILAGIVLLGAGYFMLGLGPAQFFLLSLAIIVMGNGLLKPNISSFLGRFYQSNNKLREAGFTLFYVGINIGIVLSTSLSGWVSQSFGWRVVYALAGCGMVIALVTFLMGFKSYQEQGRVIQWHTISNPFYRVIAHPVILISLCIICIGIFWAMFAHSHLANIIQLGLGAVIAAGFVLSFIIYKQQARNNMIILAILLLTSVIFWAFFFQIFFALTLFIDRLVDRNIFSIRVPTVAFTGLESFFVILLGPLFAKLWNYLAIRNCNPSALVKFCLSMSAVFAAMMMLMLAIKCSSGVHLINPLWIVFIYLLVTLGEMLLYPIGLAVVTELAPPHIAGVMMGIWFMTLGFGGMLAGQLAELAAVPKLVHSIVTIKHIYLHAFSVFAILTCAVVLILMAIIYLLKLFRVQV